MTRISLVLLAIGAVCGAGCGPPETCDGSSANCDRRYDQVTFAATHDAFAYADGGNVEYSFPNQDLPIPDQLAYGIRGFGIRPCPYWGTVPAWANVVYVTHNYSTFDGSLGGEPLLDILTEIKTFLDANPTEVISLFEEDSSVTSAQVAAVFDQAGLTPYMYANEASAGWPTLREMAKSGHRLVLFTDNTPTQPWQLPMWSLLVETNYNITDANQFSCDFYMGPATNGLYFINQFIYRDYGGGILTADPGEATIANDPTSAYNRAVACWQQMNSIPIFVYVDFYKEGNVKEAVDRLNELPR